MKLVEEAEAQPDGQKRYAAIPLTDALDELNHQWSQMIAKSD